MPADAPLAQETGAAPVAVDAVLADSSGAWDVELVGMGAALARVAVDVDVVSVDSSAVGDTALEPTLMHPVAVDAVSADSSGDGDMELARVAA